MQREARQRASFAKMALYYNAHLAVRHFGKTGPYYNQCSVLHVRHKQERRTGII